MQQGSPTTWNKRRSNRAANAHIYVRMHKHLFLSRWPIDFSISCLVTMIAASTLE